MEAAGGIGRELAGRFAAPGSTVAVDGGMGVMLLEELRDLAHFDSFGTPMTSKRP